MAVLLLVSLEPNPKRLRTHANESASNLHVRNAYRHNRGKIDGFLDLGWEKAI